MWLEAVATSQSATENLCEAFMPFRCRGMTLGALDSSVPQSDPSTQLETKTSTIYISIQPCQLPAHILACSNVKALLVTQPPLRRMGVSLFQGCVRQEHGDLERAEGLRLGDLLSKAAEICGSCKVPNGEVSHINCGRCSFSARIQRKSSTVAFSEVKQWMTTKRSAWLVFLLCSVQQYAN